MNLDRLRDCLRAPDIVLTRQEWYDLYLAAGNPLPGPQSRTPERPFPPHAREGPFSD